ncbi:hypothetical protein BpHYR1_031400 [Brachionus plicatilis]|uniref:Uncharacterized protein n=1 Tax=Brachionus plicatilis TaxID=10195 RepID=A0A3M7TAB9_BRAPC|nr:hypothetical protein BpHYR1_031400 [Brachionus plicatilis]
MYYFKFLVNGVSRFQKSAQDTFLVNFEYNSEIANHFGKADHETHDFIFTIFKNSPEEGRSLPKRVGRHIISINLIDLFNYFDLNFIYPLPLYEPNCENLIVQNILIWLKKDAQNRFLVFLNNFIGQAQYLLLVILAPNFSHNISCVTESILGLLGTFSCIDSSLESSSDSIPFGAEFEACTSMLKLQENSDICSMTIKLQIYLKIKSQEYFILKKINQFNIFITFLNNHKTFRIFLDILLKGSFFSGVCNVS